MEIVKAYAIYQQEVSVPAALFETVSIDTDTTAKES